MLKKEWKTGQIFFAFSEYLNFTPGVMILRAVVILCRHAPTHQRSVRARGDRSKVQIFWEGQKSLTHLSLFFWNYLVASNYNWKMGQIFVTFSEYLILTMADQDFGRSVNLISTRRRGQIMPAILLLVPPSQIGARGSIATPDFTDQSTLCLNQGADYAHQINTDPPPLPDFLTFLRPYTTDTVL